MARRKPLTREQRDRRAAKRERRANRPPGRRRRHTGADRGLHDALAQYVAAVVLGLEAEAGVICEKCGLDQPHRVSDELAPTQCQGFDGIGCGHEYAVTHEAFAE